MKGKYAVFLSKLCVILVTSVNIKYNLGHARFFGPHILSKLIFLVTCLNVKQNLGYV